MPTMEQFLAYLKTLQEAALLQGLDNLIIDVPTIAAHFGITPDESSELLYQYCLLCLAQPVPMA